MIFLIEPKTMKLISFLFLFLTFSAFAQKRVNPINSQEVIAKGIDLYDEEKYDDAIDEYNKVGVNDTNYAYAQYEKALSLYANEKYKDCISTLEDLIDFEIPFSEMYKVYLLRANAYDMDNRQERSLELFAEAIAKYPYQHNLLYNRALVHEKMKNYSAALKDYQKAIQVNVYHANSHLRLGLLAANEGLYEQALMSLLTFVWINPGDGRAADVMGVVERLSNGSYEKEPKGLKIYEDGDPYEEWNLLFENKVALQKNYKVKFSMDASYARQLHLLLKNVKYEEENYEFWNQHYMPFLQSVWDNGKLDSYCLVMLLTQESSKIQKTVKKKMGIIRAFYDWSKEEFKAKTSKQYMEFEGKKQIIYVDYASAHLVEFGKLDKNWEKPVGNFYYYYPNGQLRMIAHFDKAGEPEGTWEIYDEIKGYKSREVEFTGKKDEKLQREYYPTGELWVSYRMVGDFTVDTVKIFYRNGTPKEFYGMKNGERDGINIGYYPNGQMAYSYKNVNGKMEGNYVAYHPNGNVSREMSFKDDLVEGKRTIYYPNKQIRVVQNHTAGEPDGDFTEYFPDGKIMTKGSYKKGKQVGLYESYYSNGKLASSTTLDESGKENGKSIYYDLDGKKYHEFEYAKGDLSSIVFYDKNGKKEELASKKGKKINYLFKYPNGVEKVKGQYVDGAEEGNWTYYDSYGNLQKSVNYSKGAAIDTIFTYFSNGQIETASVIKDDERNGLYLVYNIFGDLIQEGTYKNGEMDNEWFDYRSDGTLEYERFFVEGQQHGVQKEFGVNSKLELWREYELGEIVSHIYMDTNENKVDEFNEYNGFVELHSANNKFVELKANYLNGNAEGKFTWYGPTGLVEAEGQYLNDERTGIWKWYDVDGKLVKQSHFTDGMTDGKVINYYPSGKKYSEFTYVNDEAQGPFVFYYEDGTKMSEGTYFDDERHGAVIYYGEKGAIRMIRNYDQGVIVSYTYLDKNGKEVAPIVMDGKEMTIVGYYKNGKKSIEHMRRNGLIEGRYVSYFENGQIYEDEMYTFGEENGLAKEYNPEGKLVKQVNYVKGEKQGMEIEYYANGKIKSETPYMYGEKHGKATFYGTDGKVKMIVTYFNDDAIEIKKF